MAGVPAGHRHLDHRRHRLDGDAARFHRRRRRRHQARRDRQAGTRLPRGHPGRGRPRGTRRPAGPARRAGSDRLPLPVRPAPAQLRAARLEHHRGHLRPRRRRLLLVPGPQRRHDHLGRLQHRRTRGRGGAARPSRRARGRRGRGARPGPRHDRPGVRRAARGRGPRRGQGRRVAGLRQAIHRPVQVPQVRRVRGRAAQDRQRENPALSPTPAGRGETSEPFGLKRFFIEPNGPWCQPGARIGAGQRRAPWPASTLQG